MRDIKFRAWDEDERIMWDIWRISNKHPCHPENGEEQYDWILLQYTGVKDKNGIEIYEGDIIRYKSITRFGEEEIEYTQEVKYSTENTAGFIPFCYETECEDSWYSYKHQDYEVVGNIYENPEILK